MLTIRVLLNIAAIPLPDGVVRYSLWLRPLSLVLPSPSCLFLHSRMQCIVVLYLKVESLFLAQVQGQCHVSRETPRAY